MKRSAGQSRAWRQLIGRDEIDALFGTANPNPDRIGCPPRRSLVSLARHRRDLADPLYEHLTECSPCYREFRTLRGGGGIGRRRAWWLAVAAAVALAVVGAWTYRLQHGTPNTAPATTVALAADLRPYSVTRSEHQATASSPLRLSRDKLDLTILLPIGSEPGAYDVRVLGDSAHVVAEASGRAEIRDFVTTLHVTLDLRTAPAGDARIAVRHQGEDWHLYPASVR